MKDLKPENICSAQCNDTFFPVVDGVVRTMHNYARIMNDISYSCVICPDQKGRYDDKKLPYDVFRTASVKIPAINYALCVPFNPYTVRDVSHIKKLDIIHIHSPFMQGWNAYLCAKKRGIPLVATFHSKFYDDFYMVTKNRKLSASLTNMVVAFFNKCDSVWACSGSTAETLRSYGYKKDIFVCENGAEISIPGDPAKLAKYGAARFSLCRGRRILLFTGSLIWQKNLKCVLDTFRLLCSKAPDKYTLVIAGSGNHEAAVKAYAEKLSFTPEQLMFTGRINDRRLLSALYAAADLFFFPSIYDNAPLVLREAAVMETPALLAEGSNSAEVITDGYNGFTAGNDPRLMAQKIEEIIDNKELLAAAGKNARETIPVSWEKIIPNVYDKYAEIIYNKKI